MKSKLGKESDMVHKMAMGKNAKEAGSLVRDVHMAIKGVVKVNDGLSMGDYKELDQKELKKLMKFYGELKDSAELAKKMIRNALPEDDIMSSCNTIRIG